MNNLKTNSGASLWERAKKIIPGGNQLLSKRAELFLPGLWPAYYEKAHGIEVWDLDGNRYIDFSIMGIGACMLGYSERHVDDCVKRAIDQGSASTLNSYEEVALADKLLELHPWGEMVRFAKTGGEINAIAVRIARAFTKKDSVAFCGYHGWSDWYLAANLGDEKSLDGQLLPGLEPNGVPRGLKGTAHPFHYGQVEELNKIIAENEVGTIIMEIARYSEPNIAFVKEVQSIAKKIGAVLIFDEVSSGFRATPGGMHIKYGLEPDMVTLGKALGNGYPITALIGKKNIMDEAQSSFISSTNWTDRIGFVAALETIKLFEDKSVATYTEKLADYMRIKLRELFSAHKIKIDVKGMPSIIILAINEDNPLVVKTFLTQEMLKLGYLAGTVIFISYAHNREYVDTYLKNLDIVVSKLVDAINKNCIKDHLIGDVCHGGFSRLN